MGKYNKLTNNLLSELTQFDLAIKKKKIVCCTNLKYKLFWSSENKMFKLGTLWQTLSFVTNIKR